MESKELLEVSLKRKEIEDVLIFLLSILRSIEKKKKTLTFGLEKLKVQLKLANSNPPYSREELIIVQDIKLLEVFTTYTLKNNLSFKDLYNYCSDYIGVCEEWIDHDECELEKNNYNSREDKNLLLVAKENLEKHEELLKVFHKLKELEKSFNISAVKISS